MLTSIFNFRKIDLYFMINRASVEFLIASNVCSSLQIAIFIKYAPCKKSQKIINANHVFLNENRHFHQDRTHAQHAFSVLKIAIFIKIAPSSRKMRITL